MKKILLTIIILNIILIPIKVGAVESIKIDDLKGQVVASGDGLYIDTYEDNRYVYKGKNPNNYIMFNNELWKIISIESDGTIKIIHYGNVGSRAFDEKGIRKTGFCEKTYDYGCSAWTKLDYFASGNRNGKVESDASINTYLNTEYYNSLNSDKQYIQTHKFNIGAANQALFRLKELIEGEEQYSWTGNVGLLSPSDYMKSNSNVEQCESPVLNSNSSEKCVQTTYLAPIKNSYWLMSPAINTVYYALIVKVNDAFDGSITKSVADPTVMKQEVEVWPSVFLKKDIELVGLGTQDNPYKIVMNTTNNDNSSDNNVVNTLTKEDNNKTATNSKVSVPNTGV